MQFIVLVTMAGEYFRNFLRRVRSYCEFICSYALNVTFSAVQYLTVHAMSAYVWFPWGIIFFYFGDIEKVVEFCYSICRKHKNCCGKWRRMSINFYSNSRYFVLVLLNSKLYFSPKWKVKIINSLSYWIYSSTMIRQDYK